MNICGWDIGGAHVKFALLDDQGRCVAVEALACPLWQGIAYLERSLAEINAKFHVEPMRHAITMTGELCDNFDNRVEGVNAILAAFRRTLSVPQYSAYTSNGTWLDNEQFESVAGQTIASANWHATASLIAAKKPNSILVDIGSTTTDFVPIANGQVIARGTDDRTRLQHGELVYMGIVRTPVMAITDTLAVEGRATPLMAEHFATVADAYRILGEIPDTADLHAPADGGDKSTEGSARRLLRMVGVDDSTTAVESKTQASAIAREIRWKQLHRWQRELIRMLSRVEFLKVAPTVIGVGPGEFIAEELARMSGLNYVSFIDCVAKEINAHPHAEACAPAIAVAKLYFLAS